MFIQAKGESKRNYIIEAIALTLIVACIGLNVFSDNLGLTSKSEAPESFQGFKMVNTSQFSR